MRWRCLVLERYKEEHCPTFFISHTFDFGRNRNGHFYFNFLIIFSWDVLEQTHEHIFTHFVREVITYNQKAKKCLLFTRVMKCKCALHVELRAIYDFFHHTSAGFTVLKNSLGHCILAVKIMFLSLSSCPRIYKCDMSVVEARTHNSKAISCQNITGYLHKLFQPKNNLDSISVRNHPWTFLLHISGSQGHGICHPNTTVSSRNW